MVKPRQPPPPTHTCGGPTESVPTKAETEAAFRAAMPAFLSNPRLAHIAEGIQAGFAQARSSFFPEGSPTEAVKTHPPPKPKVPSSKLGALQRSLEDRILDRKRKVQQLQDIAREHVDQLRALRLARKELRGELSDLRGDLQAVRSTLEEHD